MERRSEMLVKNLSYRFKNQKEDFLKNISLNFSRPSFYAVVGENGSGKSTLLDLLGFVEIPQAGVIDLESEGFEPVNRSSKISKLRKYRQHNILLLQYSNLQFFHDTIYEDLVFGISREVKKNFDDKLKYYLEKFSLPSDIIKRNYSEISGGELKKLALISGLLLEPEILLLDEPMNNIDTNSQDDIMRILRDMNITVIFSSHSIDFVDRYGDYIIEIKNGKVEKENVKEDFFRDKFLAKDIDYLPSLYQYLVGYLQMNNKEMKEKYYDEIKNTEDLVNLIQKEGYE